MAETLKSFEEGEDILASETNSNNQYLLSKLSDNAAQVQNYVEGQVASIKSNVASVQSTLQGNIDAVNATANSKISATISKATNGYCKLSNGLIMQWGAFKPVSRGSGTTSLPTNFSNSTYILTLTQNSAGPIDDYANSICVKSKAVSSFSYQTGHAETPIYNFIAIGY